MLRFEALELQDERPGASAGWRDRSIPLSAPPTAPLADVLVVPTPRMGLFARLLGALHHSRRLQAQNVLRAHHHLRVGTLSGGMASQDTSIASGTD